MQIREIMNRHVRIISPNDTIENAANLMEETNCGSLPVSENDRLIGVVTDRDITLRAVAKGKSPQTCKVREVMSHGVKYIFDDETTEGAANTMSGQHIRRLPVLDHNKRLVGIIALGDLARWRDGSIASKALREISIPP